MREKMVGPAPIQRLFQRVDEFSGEKRKHRKLLAEMEKGILTDYSGLGREERAEFFSMLYDRFAERYDEHMESTGHFRAIRKVLAFAGQHLELPLVDLTAGTGEPLAYAMRLMKIKNMLDCLPLDGVEDVLANFDISYRTINVTANEISPKMLEKAKAKINVEFTSYNALDLPDDERLKAMTVLCCQTFHLLTDDDKTALVRSMRGILYPGGKAIVVEEDPFRISETESIDQVSLFLRAVTQPIKHRGKLRGLFITNGFEHMEQRAAYPIDDDHIMRLHLFRRRN